MSTLSDIRDAWDKDVGDGRDEGGTRALADEYVAANPEQFTALQGLTQDQCVQAIDVLRDQPDNAFLSVLKTALGVDDWFVVQVWLWHHFEPQNIGGELQPIVRIIH